MNNKTIIDSFLFFNEIELLKVRLNYLGKDVDYFVISEANIDFSGRPKDHYLKDIIPSLPYAEKIIYRPININLWSIQWILKRLRWITRPHKFLWKIQDAQRNSVLEIIQDKKIVSDYVLFGDLDEIPNLELIQELRYGRMILESPKTFRQRLFYYHPDIATNYEGWLGTICIPFQLFMKLRPHQLRSNRENLAFIENGGFHLSYFMTPENMKIKINAIANVERVEASKLLTTFDIKNLILENKDLFGRNLGFVRDKNLLTEELRLILQTYMPWTAEEITQYEKNCTVQN
jgi:beta-1,4-mannosyl-glycoprotein beta-1,4-N-acetylglucosaminyltransferase